MSLGLYPFLAALPGGALIGLAAGGLYLVSGRIAGVSGVLAGAARLEPGAWRWAFVAGLAIAGVGARLLGAPTPPALLALAPAAAVVAGLLVGLGAKAGSGCTSGHGVCGLARLSPRSLAAVAVFMTTAALTVFATHHLGSAS